MDSSQINEDWQERPGKLTFDGYSFRRVFQVVADYDYEGFPTVLEKAQSHGVPSLGDDYSSDYGGSIVTSIAPERNLDRPSVWKFEIRYEKPDTEPTPDPANKPAEINTGWESEQITMEKAYSTSDSKGSPSVAVQNSAGLRYSNPPQKTKHLRSLEITVFMDDSEYQSYDFKSYMKTINSTSVKFVGFPLDVEEGYIRTIDPQPHRDKRGDLYWEVVFDILQDEEDLHKREVLDAGFLVKDPNDSSKRVPMSAKKPIPLDGNGNPLDPSNWDFDNFTYHSYRPWAIKDWSGLPIPEEYGD